MSKVYARADGHGRPLGFVLTGGEATDYKAVHELVWLLVSKPRGHVGRQGLSRRRGPHRAASSGHPAGDPAKGQRKQPAACEFCAYKDRNRIERMFNRLKQARRIATRYDSTA